MKLELRGNIIRPFKNLQEAKWAPEITPVSFRGGYLAKLEGKLYDEAGLIPEDMVTQRDLEEETTNSSS